MSMSPRLLRPRESFTPKSISGLALWLDASDASTLYQNSDGTTPATTAGDPVGYWRDKSGNNRHATQSLAASRPTATTANGRKAVAFDGANGWLKTNRTTYAARSVFAVFRRTATVAQGSFRGPFAKQAGNTDASYGGTASTSAQTGGWSGTSTGGSDRLYWNNDALTASFHNGASISVADSRNYQVGFPAPIDTTTPAILYAEVSGEAPGNQCWFVGTEPYSSLRKYPADFCEALIYSRALTSSERRRVEQYLANRWGITLAPQVSDPDAQDWINRVYSNGGTVSTATASAVNTFCEAIAAANIRDRFFRLNLFAGTATASLTNCGAIVPLYRGPSLSGTQYGGTVDTPNASPAYTEFGASGGFLGNGSTSYLNTGLSIANIGTFTSGHLSVYHGQSTGTNVNRYYIAANDAATSNRFYLGTDTFSTSQVVAIYGATLTANQSLAPQGHGSAGHRILSRTNSASLTHYHNGEVVGSNSTDVVGGGALCTASFPVFCQNSNGTYSRFHNSWIAAYSIGLGMDSNQVAAYTAAMQAFQTAMGRQV